MALPRRLPPSPLRRPTRLAARPLAARPPASGPTGIEEGEGGNACAARRRRQSAARPPPGTPPPARPSAPPAPDAPGDGRHMGARPPACVAPLPLRRRSGASSSAPAGGLGSRADGSNRQQHQRELPAPGKEEGVRSRCASRTKPCRPRGPGGERGVRRGWEGGLPGALTPVGGPPRLLDRPGAPAPRPARPLGRTPARVGGAGGRSAATPRLRPVPRDLGGGANPTPTCCYRPQLLRLGAGKKLAGPAAPRFLQGFTPVANHAFSVSFYKNPAGAPAGAGPRRPSTGLTVRKQTRCPPPVLPRRPAPDLSPSKSLKAGRYTTVS